MALINSGPFFLLDNVDIVNVGKVLLDHVDFGPVIGFLAHVNLGKVVFLLMSLQVISHSVFSFFLSLKCF